MFRASCDALASDESHARVIVEGRAQLRHGFVGVVAIGLVTPTGPRGDTYQWLMLLAGKSLWRTCTPRPWATRRCMGIVVYPARLVAGWVAYVRRCVAVPWGFVGGWVGGSRFWHNIVAHQRAGSLRARSQACRRRQGVRRQLGSARRMVDKQGNQERRPRRSSLRRCHTAAMSRLITSQGPSRCWCTN